MLLQLCNLGTWIVYFCVHKWFPTNIRQSIRCNKKYGSKHSTRKQSTCIWQQKWTTANYSEMAKIEEFASMMFVKYREMDREILRCANAEKI